jgi:hypothetical protein
MTPTPAATASEKRNKSMSPHKWLFFAGALALFIGLNGAFYDVTYHLTHKVDTFFQPAHLLIYSNIFASAIIGAVLFVKTRFKSLMIFGSLIFGFGMVDMLWHNVYGFDSFLSPPHVLVISSAILGAWMMFRKFKEMNSKTGKVISLVGFMVGITLLLLSFSLTFAKNSSDNDGGGYYLIPTREVSAFVGFALLPASSVIVAKSSHLTGIKYFHVAIIFAACMMLTTILSNPTITFTAPYFLAGTLVSGYLYDKNSKYGTILLGGAWVLVFTPYSYQIVAYVVSGEILSVAQTSEFIYSLGPYYPLAAAIGIFSAIVTSRMLKPEFMMRWLMLRKTGLTVR